MTARRLPYAPGRRAARPAMAALAAMTFAACGEPTGPAPEVITELPRELTAAEVGVIEASNAFAFGFLRELFAAREGQNVFTSPLSASMAFGMATNGADGETWTQMRNALGFHRLTELQMNEAYRDLIALLRDLDPAVTFAIGNALWADRSVPLLPDFIGRVREYFGAEARAVDFADPATREAINDWVAEVTDGRIETLLESIPPDIVMYLVNAIYFQGDWRSRFERDRTAPGPFTTLEGATVDVPMMAGEVGHRVLFRDDATIAELPYGGGAFTAVAVLPPLGRPMDAFLADLDADRWADWMEALAVAAAAEGLEEEGILVRLPRLELEWGGDLIGAMQALGMARAFEPHQADFSRLTGGPDLYIQQALQKTFLKVDEEGTTAAAATAVGFGPTSAPLAASFDRPFVLAIRERLSGTLLFLGVIGDPTGHGPA